MDAATLFWGVLFSSLGLGYFLYGRRQKAPVPLVCGIGLMVFPYFVAKALLLVLIGAALAAAPFFLKL
jgi:hypothetical protein